MSTILVYGLLGLKTWSLTQLMDDVDICVDPCAKEFYWIRKKHQGNQDLFKYASTFVTRP